MDVIQLILFDIYNDIHVHVHDVCQFKTNCTAKNKIICGSFNSISTLDHYDQTATCT